MDKIVNPFPFYLKKTGENIMDFSKRAYIAPSTLYSMMKGHKPRRALVRKICKNSGGELKMEDFGYE